MPQSFCQIYGHLIFSTKDRAPLLDAEIRPRVHGYLATLVRDLDSAYVVVGGVADHVHLLFDLNKKHTPIEYVEITKRESSKFIKKLGERYRDFYWQRGYGLFSVSTVDRANVERYVRNQEAHHRTESFQDEFRKFLTRYRIEFDERYVWD